MIPMPDMRKVVLLVFATALFIGMALGILVAPVFNQAHETAGELQVQIARLQAEVDVDAKSSFTVGGWVTMSDFRTRAGNLAVLKERLRQLEATTGKAGQ